MADDRTRVKIIVGAVLASICASPAWANGDTTGTVTQLRISSYVLVQLSAAPAGTRPGCATTTIFAGTIDLSTAAGQAQYAAILTAEASNTSIRVLGAGACTLNAASEDVASVNSPSP